MPTGIVQLPAGSWWSVLIGALLMLLLLTWVLLAASHHLQRRHTAGATPAGPTPAPGNSVTLLRPAPTAPTTVPQAPLARAKRRQIEKDRSVLLIAEAVLVRKRLAGQIDTSTYQVGMHKLASGHQR